MSLPRRPARLLLFLFLTVACLGCDRVTKRAAVESLQHREPIEVAGGLLRLEYAENTGAFLGLGSSLADSARFWILGVVTAALLVVVATVLLRRRGLRRTTFLALTLVLAGGLGNLFDRLKEGFVVDFLVIDLGPVQTGVFNVADMAITGGVVMLLLADFVRRKEPVPEPSG